MRRIIAKVIAGLNWPPEIKPVKTIEHQRVPATAKGSPRLTPIENTKKNVPRPSAINSFIIYIDGWRSLEAEVGEGGGVGLGKRVGAD